ncbi:NLR family CARD domain-containing protein 3 [Tachysurus ichikawai]
MDDEDAMSDNSVPFGYGASAFGSEGEEEEEDVAVHRESALRHMEWETAAESYDVARAASPAPSYDSMCSDDGIGAQAESRCKIQLYRKDSSGSSCSSSSSDEKPNEEPKEEETMQEIPTPSLKPELLIDPNETRHPALTVDFAFKVLQSSLKQLREEHFKRFKRILWERYPEYFRDQLSSLDIIDLVDKMLEICGLEVSLKITLNVLLNDMKCKYVAEQLQGMCKRNEVRYELKKTLRRLYEHVSEDLSQQTLFEDVRTDLYFTDGGNAAVNSEHEFRQIQELQEDVRSKNNPLSLTDIFNPKDIEKKHIRTVITKGIVRRLLEKDLQSGERPKGLTQFYTKLLLLHINKRCQKLLSQDPEFFLKLGNMAFQLLEKGVFTIEKDLWDKFALRADDAVVTAGLCTQFYRETFMMYQEKVDCFIHPTVQDYLAALYVFLSFKKHKKNVLDSTKRKGFPVFKGDLELYKSAVDKVLHSKNGNYDLFLQFLLGMSKETNQELLSILSGNTRTKQEAREETAIYVKKMFREYPERKEYLQRCLDEVLSTSTTTLN